MQFMHDIAVNRFLVTGLCAGVIAGIACGVMGPYVVTRRAVFLSGAIAHVAVGGVGAAIFLRWCFPDALSWLTPTHGAMAAAVAGAMIVALLAEYATERLDTLIGALWAVGMSVGLLLLKLTGEYHTELMGYLFGNISLVSWGQVGLSGALCAGLLIVVAGVHKQFAALCVDEEQARLQGVSPLRLNLLLLVLVSLTVVCLMQVVGLILMLALLTLPAATAGHWTTRLGSMMAVSCGLGVMLTTVPRVLVYDLRIGNGAVSAEAAIVIAAGAIYLVSVVVRRIAQARPSPL